MTENGKEGKSKMIASCGFLENELSQFSTEEGITFTDGMETLGVDMRKKVKSLGERRKEMQGEVLNHTDNKAFQKNYMKVGVKTLLRAGMMPARTW